MTDDNSPDTVPADEETDQERLAKRLREGLEAADKGETEDLGDFTKYVDDTDSDD